MRSPGARVVLLMVVFIVQAGCLTDETGNLIAGGSAGRLLLGEPSLVHQYGPALQHEVYLDASPDGMTVLTCGHGQFQRGAYYFASTDAGATWRVLAPFPDPTMGGDCEVAIGADGAWYFLTSTIVGATVSTTQDQGKTWFTTPVTALPIGGLADRPWLETVENAVVLSFMPLSLQPGAVGVTRSTDHGRTWAAPQYLSTPDTSNTNAMNMPPQVLGDGTLRIPLGLYKETQGRQIVPRPTTFAFAETKDAGATWRTYPVVGPVPGVIDLIVTSAQAAGNAYFFFHQEVDGMRRIAEIHSVDDGKTWSEPASLLDDAQGASIPAADARPDGSALFGIVVGDKQYGGVTSNADNTLHIFDVDASGALLVRDHLTIANASYFEFPVAFDHDADGNGWLMQLTEKGELLQRLVRFEAAASADG